MLERLYDAHVIMNDKGDTKMMYSYMDELEEKMGESMSLELSELLLDYTREVERKGFIDGFKSGALFIMECIQK